MLIGDSAYPLTAYPAQWGAQPVVGWAVYIPGGDAYHGWSQAEVEALKAMPWCRYLLPIFVRSNPQGAAQAQADAAVVVAWCHAQGQPARSAVELDFESEVDAAYAAAFNAALLAAGFAEVLYGTGSTVVRNPAPSAGYNEAAWTGVDSPPVSTAQQFLSTAAYDLNDFRPDAPLWDLRPPAAPPPDPAPQEDDVNTTSDSTGRAGLSWAAGSRHVVQATYDPAGGDPVLRVVLAITTGPWVAPDPWRPTGGSGVYEIPADLVGNCRGVILEDSAGVAYDACAV
jgi:hypothetical protein